MGFGSSLSDALSTASDAAKHSLRDIGAAGVNAKAKTVALVNSASAATANAVQSIASSVASATITAAKKSLAIALIGSEVAVGTIGYGLYKDASALSGKVSNAFETVKAGMATVKEKFSPHKQVSSPCLRCLNQEKGADRKARIERRNVLIDQGAGSPNPAVRAAAGELKGDMKAVEMARLSDNTYAQYDLDIPDAMRKPPEPWTAMSKKDMEEAGLDLKQVSLSKAVIYKVPDDFPFDPKTIVAFRGTTGEADDVLTDHDQALGISRTQYENSRLLGQRLHDVFPDAEVTGHSLGGGKAQAAGVAGHLKGIMFNSAGLHPKMVMESADGLLPYADNFIQYRSAGGLGQGGGDPLTGTQNSMVAQKTALGLVSGVKGVASVNKWAVDELGLGEWVGSKVPKDMKAVANGLLDRVLNVTSEQAQQNFEFSGGKWYIPPALGEVRGVPSKTLDNEDSGIAAQHSVTNLVYGIESRKARDVQALLDGTGMGGSAGDYLGPMVSK